MITFKQQFTFQAEAVKAFAIYLGWKEKLTRRIEVVDDDTTVPVTTHFEAEEYDNPQTFAEFVDEKAREHSLLFTRQYAEHLKTEILQAQINTLKEESESTLYAEIVAPVEQALISEIIEE